MKPPKIIAVAVMPLLIFATASRSLALDVQVLLTAAKAKCYYAPNTKAKVRIVLNANSAYTLYDQTIKDWNKLHYPECFVQRKDLKYIVQQASTATVQTPTPSIPETPVRPQPEAKEPENLEPKQPTPTRKPPKVVDPFTYEGFLGIQVGDTYSDLTANRGYVFFDSDWKVDSESAFQGHREVCVKAERDRAYARVCFTNGAVSYKSQYGLK
jgi:hypothetical protein